MATNLQIFLIFWAKIGIGQKKMIVLTEFGKTCQRHEGPTTGEAARYDLRSAWECQKITTEIQKRFSPFERHISWEGVIDSPSTPYSCYFVPHIHYDLVYWNKKEHGRGNRYVKSICELGLRK